MLECICVRLWSSCFFVCVHVKHILAKKEKMSGTIRRQEPKTPDLLIRMLRLRPRPTTRKKLRQVDLAGRVGVDTRTIQQWENGERLPSPESLQRLITAFVDEKIFLPGEEKNKVLRCARNCAGPGSSPKDWKVWQRLSVNRATMYVPQPC